MTLETNKIYKRCFIGLGSNLEKPIQQVQTAIDTLKSLDNCKWVGMSSLYRSAPVGPAGQDDYINAVACIDTLLAPEELLDSLQSIENKQGRVRLERWGSRTLDLDILLIGDLIINTDRLVIPHPYIAERNFVLVPLAELDHTLTINNKRISNLIDNCPAGDLNKI